MMHFKLAAGYSTHRVLNTAQTSAWKNVTFWFKPLRRQNPGYGAV